MKIEYDKWRTKNVICNNWGEFFNYFTKWHAKNKSVIPLESIHNEEKFSNYVGFDGESFGDFWPRNEKGETRVGWPWEYRKDNKEVYAVETVLGPFHKIGCPVDELVVLVLNLKVKYNDWKNQEEKAGKVLREIWTTGKSENYQGLDLNWPTTSQSHQKFNFPVSSNSINKIDLWVGTTSVFLFLLAGTYFLFKKLKWL